MMDAALAKFQQITKYDWFSHVGEPLPPEVDREDHQETALLHLASSKWENCRLEAHNTFHRHIQLKYRDNLKLWERAEQWNPICRRLRPDILSFIATLKDRPTALSSEIDRIKNDLAWDILGICLEWEFQDITPAIFCVPLLDPWYQRGHLPCGWTGPKFPPGWDGATFKGKLIVH